MQRSRESFKMRNQDMIDCIKKNDLSTKDSEKEDDHNRSKGKDQDENEEDESEEDFDIL